MEEQRRFVRLDTRLDVSYAVLPTEQMQGAATKNISGEGICFFTKQALIPGTRLQVAMKLPNQEQPVNFTAEVMWSESYEMIGKTERHRTAETGVRFVEVSPKDRDTIMQHVILNLQKQ